MLEMNASFFFFCFSARQQTQALKHAKQELYQRVSNVLPKSGVLLTNILDDSEVKPNLESTDWPRVGELSSTQCHVTNGCLKKLPASLYLCPLSFHQEILAIQMNDTKPCHFQSLQSFPVRHHLK